MAAVPRRARGAHRSRRDHRARLPLLGRALREGDCAVPFRRARGNAQRGGRDSRRLRLLLESLYRSRLAVRRCQGTICRARVLCYPTAKQRGSHLGDDECE